MNDDSVVAPALHDVDMSGSPMSARFGTRPIKVMQLLRPLKQLLHLDADTAHHIHGALLSSLSEGTGQYTSVARAAGERLSYEAVSSMKRDSIASRRHARVSTSIALPPFVIKYLGKTFNAWHIVFELLQDSLKHLRDEETVHDVALDALAEHSVKTICSTFQQCALQWAGVLDSHCTETATMGHTYWTC